MLYPDFFARFFDLIYHQMRDAADHDYFLNKMKRAAGPVLEVGTGTGRLFKDALESGIDVYGVDISPAMLEVLMNKIPPHEHHRVEVQDISKLVTKRKYNLIVAPFRVFMHLTETEKQLGSLNNIYKALEPGGTFIFDTFVPDMKMLYEGLDRVKDFEGEYAPGKKVSRIVSMQADVVKQLSHITFTFEWDEDGDKRIKEWHTDLRLFFRYELEHLVARSKLSLVNIFGDFQENELDKHSKEFIVICRKMG